MAAERKAVVVVGSINMDLVVCAERVPLAGETIAGSSFQTHPGGKGANQAVAVARLGCPVRMIGRVGDDAFGVQLIEELENAGVDVAGVATSEGASGVAVIVVSDTGENSIVVTPGANALLTPADVDRHIEVIRAAGVTLTQLEVPLETVQHLAMICAKEGVPLILDPAPARALQPELLRNVTWFTPNETEAAFFLGGNTTSLDPAQAAEELMAKGVGGVILKMGSRGAYLRSADKPGRQLIPFTVKAVDSTAAGDAFNGAFAASLMTGKGEVESARFAGAAAAISVTRAGAQPSMPVMAEVEELIAHFEADQLRT